MRTVLKNDAEHSKTILRSQLQLLLSVSLSLSTLWLTHRITENYQFMFKQFYTMQSQSISKVWKISWLLSIKTSLLTFKPLLTHLLILSQSASSFRLLSLRKTLNEICTDMMTVIINTWVISVTVTETARIEVLDLKKTEMISMAVFILIFLVKVNIRLHISLNISLLIVNSLFLLQTVQYKTLFLFILWIKIPHLIAISSDLLI